MAQTAEPGSLRSIVHVLTSRRLRVAVVQFAAAVVVAIVVGDARAATTGWKHHYRSIIGWIGALIFALLWLAAVQRIAKVIGQVTAVRGGPAAASLLRVVVLLVGDMFGVAAALAVAGLDVQKLIVGAGLTGVIVGIAAQQSLSNVFAGFVLLFARPFVVGDVIWLRSGALGGTVTGKVLAMGLTYVRLETIHGLVHVPNASVLSAIASPATNGMDGDVRDTL